MPGDNMDCRISPGAQIIRSFFSVPVSYTHLDLRRHGIRMKVFPEHPTLVYRPFTVNKNNYIYLTDNGRIHANLDLHDEQGTGLSFYTNREDTICLLYTSRCV